MEPEYLTKFRAFTRIEPTLAELDALERELYGESDRVTAILLGSMVERSLHRLISAAAGQYPPLEDRRTFLVKIEDADVRRLVGPISKSDLNLVRELRNGFAHSRMPLCLTTPEVAEVCAHLTMPDLDGSFIPFAYLERVPEARLAEAHDKTHPRTRFIMASHNLAYRMIIARTPPEELIEGAFLDDPLP